MIELRRKVLILTLRLTAVCDALDSLAIKREIKAGKERKAVTYYCRPVVKSRSESRFNYSIFPIPLDRARKPWVLGNQLPSHQVGR